MEWIVAVVALAVGFVLARRGYLHPYDYVVAAGLALLLALSLLPALPPDSQRRVFDTLGAPEAAVARDVFLRNHGVPIVIAAFVFALGACAEAWLRARHGAWDRE